MPSIVGLSCLTVCLHNPSISLTLVSSQVKISQAEHHGKNSASGEQLYHSPGKNYTPGKEFYPRGRILPLVKNSAPREEMYLIEITQV